jgi:hypothetical protein
MRMLLWIIVLIVAGFQVIDLFFSLNSATGAPQQAAIAAIAAAWMIAVYVIARAAESIVALSREPAVAGPVVSDAERTHAYKRNQRILYVVLAVVLVAWALPSLQRWGLEIVYLIPSEWLR